MIRVQLYTVQCALSDFCTCTVHVIRSTRYCTTLYTYTYTYTQCTVTSWTTVGSSPLTPCRPQLACEPSRAALRRRNHRSRLVRSTRLVTSNPPVRGRYFIGQLKGVAVERHHVKSRGDAWVKTRPSQWNDVRRAWRSYGDRSHLNRGARETAFALRDPSPPSPLARASQPRAAPSARHCGFVTPSRGDSWSGPSVSRTEKTSQSQQPKPNRPIRFTRKKNSEYGGDINARNR